MPTRPVATARLHPPPLLFQVLASGQQKCAKLTIAGGEHRRSENSEQMP
jgi:hypothetical protein